MDTRNPHIPEHTEGLVVKSKRKHESSTASPTVWHAVSVSLPSQTLLSTVEMVEAIYKIRKLIQCSKIVIHNRDQPKFCIIYKIKFKISLIALQTLRSYQGVLILFR